MKNPFTQLLKLFSKPATVPPASIQEPKEFSEEDRKLLQRIGATQNELRESMVHSTQINFERTVLYREVDRAVLHWLVGSAVELYADYSTAYNQLQHASVWITGEKLYVSTLTKLLDAIGIEEKIFDWGWTTGAYGDLFVQAIGKPGLGIVSVEDSEHPANISRVDYQGMLVGFYRTPFESGGFGVAAGEQPLLPPWEYSHFRVLGAKKKRPAYSDPTFSEYRTIHLMGPEIRQITSRYGTSLLINALPIYKRLRLAEDSVLMARLHRGILRYLYKIKVTGLNPEAAGTIVDEYMTILKRARALSTDPNSPNYDSKGNPMGVVEDLFIPVWGEANDVVVEELGGKPDIRWIVDVEELRNQLASALRVPLSLLGGFVQEASGQLGAEAISQLDIRFARSARRLQRALIEGITRLCQIHLAYMNMDPDTKLFQVNMSETSTAEEEILREALDKGVDTIQKFLDMLDFDTTIDKLGVLDYLNQKILKLSDFDLSSYKLSDKTFTGESKARVILEYIRKLKEKEEAKIAKRDGKVVGNLDFLAALPLSKKVGGYDLGSKWEKDYSINEKRMEVKITVEEEPEVKEEKKEEESKGEG